MAALQDLENYDKTYVALGRAILRCKVEEWDEARSSQEFNSIIPKLLQVTENAILAATLARKLAQEQDALQQSDGTPRSPMTTHPNRLTSFTAISETGTSASVRSQLMETACSDDEVLADHDKPHSNEDDVPPRISEDEDITYEVVPRTMSIPYCNHFHNRLRPTFLVTLGSSHLRPALLRAGLIAHSCGPHGPAACSRPLPYYHQPLVDCADVNGLSSCHIICNSTRIEYCCQHKF
jgi:hypothetical protein